MAKKIIIKIGYDTAVALPAACFQHVDEIIPLKIEGYTSSSYEFVRDQKPVEMFLVDDSAILDAPTPKAET